MTARTLCIACFAAAALAALALAREARGQRPDPQPEARDDLDAGRRDPQASPDRRSRYADDSDRDGRRRPPPGDPPGRFPGQPGASPGQYPGGVGPGGFGFPGFGPGGAGGGLGGLGPGGGGARDPEMEEIDRQEAEAQQQTVDLANQYRSGNAADREKLRADLKKAIDAHFNIRQQRRQLSLKRIEEEVARLREAIKSREDARESIIERRFSQMVGEESEPGF
jgi:hypothetical protein